MAVASMAEGTSQVCLALPIYLVVDQTFVQVMQRELGTVVEYVPRRNPLKFPLTSCQISLVTPKFKDTHPRVRHAACQCM